MVIRSSLLAYLSNILFDLCNFLYVICKQNQNVK